MTFEMKRLLSALLCLFLAAGLLSFSAAPARAETDGDWQYSIRNGEATVTDYFGSGGSVTVPSVLGGKPVTAVGGSVFYGRTALQSIVIPEGVTGIGNYAFYGCTGLTSLSIPASLREIGYSAFEKCSALTRVNITDLASWLRIAFSSRDANPLSFAHVLYLNGHALTALTIPAGVTSIGNYALSGCSTLQSVSFPAGVTSVGKGAFSDCLNLNRVDAPDLASWAGIEFGDSEANPLTHAGKLYIGGTLLRKAALPAGLARVGSWTFSNCTGLTTLTIPAGVTEIGSGAFSHCAALTGTLALPSGLTDIGYSAFDGCGMLSAVSFPSGLRSIGRYAFRDCSGLTELSLPNGVTELEDEAFCCCTDLTRVTIPGSVTAIGKGVFGGCTGLTSAGPAGSGCVLEFGWTDGIPKNAFSSDWGGYVPLCTVVLPAAVTGIGESAFAGCADLAHIYYGGTGEQWNALPVSGDNDPLSGAELHFGWRAGDPIAVRSGSCGDGLTYTVDQTGLLTVRGSGAIEINAAAREKWTSLITRAVLGSGVTGIGSGAFSACQRLQSVTIPAKVTGIGGEAFSGCTALTSITFPQGVVEIGDGAFRGSAGLTVATIPVSVTDIGSDAFSGCAALAKVYYAGNRLQWHSIGIGTGNEPLTDALLCICEPPEITASPGIGSISVAWSQVPGATKYALSRREYHGAWSEWETLNSTLNGSGYTDAAVSEGTVYQYRMQAYVNAWSGFSNSVNAKVLTKPDAPALSASCAAGQIGISWNAVAGATKYTLYRREYHSSWSAWEAVKTNLTGTSWSDTGVVEGTEYQYRMRAYNGLWSDYSAPVNIRALSKPAAPTVTVSCASGKVSVAWSSVSGATKYTVYRRAYSGSWSAWEAVKTNLTGTSWSDTGVVEGTEYQYRMRAYNGLWSDYSASVNIRVLSKPAAPTVTASFASGKVSVTWNAVSGATKYTVYRRAYSGSWGDWEAVKTNLTGTSWSDTGITAGTEYQYRMRAYNGIWSDYSAAVNVKTAMPKPAAPAVTASYASGKVTVNWNAVSGASKYALYRREYSGSWSSWTAVSTALTGTSYADGSVTPGTTYQYRMKAYNGTWSDYSASAEVNVVNKPAAPTFTVSYEDGVMHVAWNAVSGAKKYALYRSCYRNGAWTSWTTVGTQLTGTSYTDPGVEEGYRYQYRMKAYNGLWSDYTPVVNVYSVSVPPAAPVISASVGSGKIVVTWGSVEGGIKYAVYRAAYEDGKWGKWTALSTTVKGANTSYEDKTAQAGVKYQYRMKAFNGLWSVYSNTVTVTGK